MFKLKIFSVPATIRGPLCSKLWYSSYIPNQNHYDVLGIYKESSNEEIKRAYYEQSKQYHPDKKEGNQERFREITSAYEVLGNPRLRKMYDRGLISSSTPIYPSPDHHPNDSEIVTDKTASPSISMPHLDHWSKEQYSHTFAKDQLRKSNQLTKQRLKAQKQDSVKLQGAFWCLGSILLGIYVYLQRVHGKKPDPKN